jgi:hypothetical protein
MGDSVTHSGLAVAQSGEAIALWGEPAQMMTATRLATGGWSPPRTISTQEHDPTDVTVAVSAKGDAVAAWTDPVPAGGPRVSGVIRTSTTR